MCEFERARGHEKGIQINKMRSKDPKGYFGRNRKFKRFFQPKSGDLSEDLFFFQPKKKKVFSEIARDFPAKIGNLSGFSGRRQVISKKKRYSLKLQGIFRPQSEIQAVFPAENRLSPKKKKRKGLHPKNVMKSGVSPQKTPIWASICTPIASSLLISSGHSSRLGGHNFPLGGHKQSFGRARPRYASPWRRVCDVLIYPRQNSS